MKLIANLVVAFLFGIVCAITAAFDACYSRKWDRRAGVSRK